MDQYHRTNRYLRGFSGDDELDREEEEGMSRNNNSLDRMILTLPYRSFDHLRQGVSQDHCLERTVSKRSTNLQSTEVGQVSELRGGGSA